MARSGAVAGTAIGVFFKVLAALFALLLPLLGVWVASSLAAYLNGPVWAVVLAGLVLVPLGPLGWDLFAEWRAKRKKGGAGKRFLTFADRLILRTLSLNAVFLVVLLATAPSKGFEAISTRGDWMVDGSDGGAAEGVRKTLFWCAERLEWLYKAASDNPYEDMGDPSAREADDAAPDDPKPAAELDLAPSSTPKPSPQPKPSSSGAPVPDNEPEPTPEAPPVARKAWPLEEALHPAVTTIPADAEKSIDAVGKYLAAQEKDRFWLAKALHDYVADRIAYDADSYLAWKKDKRVRFPPQDANTVFTTRVGVCAGYANLLTALGKASGMNIVWVPGVARGDDDDLTGEGHAWNAVEIDGAWYLLDATWDSGGISTGAFQKNYRTTYLFTPPRAFGLDHFPDAPRWQLRDNPLSRGDFFRQPNLTPLFFADGFDLVSPERSQVTVSGSLGITLDNPRGLFLIATYAPFEGGGEGTRCDITLGARSGVNCAFPSDGRYRVNVFASPVQYNATYHHVASFSANNDG
jgi:transglutaminase-like putative cysteine protease